MNDLAFIVLADIVDQLHGAYHDYPGGPHRAVLLCAMEAAGIVDEVDFVGLLEGRGAVVTVPDGSDGCGCAGCDACGGDCERTHGGDAGGDRG